MRKALLITPFLIVFSGFHLFNDSTNKMSDTLLKFIPANPNFVPDNSRQNQAKSFLNNIFKGAVIKFEVTKDVEFIDPGSNFENVSCNFCGHVIAIDIWQKAMDEAYKNHFKELKFLTPCCHKPTSLNDLKYEGPSGFARFQISISNPGDDITDNEFAKLENTLGTKIRKIWAHY